MDIKKFKKEMAGRSKYEKIHDAIGAVSHVMKKEVATSKFLRKNMAKKMRAKDQVDLDTHNEGKGHKGNYK